MIVSNHIHIKQKAEIIASLILDPQNREHFHDGFNGSTLLKGVYPEEGAVTRIYFRQKKDIKLQETIIRNEFPDYFKAFYHHKHMDNNLEIWMTKNENGHTEFKYQMTYTRFANVLLRTLSKIFKRKFQEQGDTWMMRIKQYAELSQHNQ